MGHFACERDLPNRLIGHFSMTHAMSSQSMARQIDESLKSVL